MTEPRPSAASKTGAPVEDISLKGMPFETALAELEEIVRQLEQGDVPLERSIAIYERGETLKRHCDGLLKTAEQRIQKIATGPDGKASGVAPLDVE